MEGQANLKVMKQLNISHHQSRAGFIPNYSRHALQFVNPNPPDSPLPQMVVDLSAGDSQTSELKNSIADLPDVQILEAFVKLDPLLH